MEKEKRSLLPMLMLIRCLLISWIGCDVGLKSVKDECVYVLGATLPLTHIFSVFKSNVYCRKQKVLPFNDYLINFTLHVFTVFVALCSSITVAG